MVLTGGIEINVPDARRQRALAGIALARFAVLQVLDGNHNVLQYPGSNDILKLDIPFLAVLDKLVPPAQANPGDVGSDALPPVIMVVLRLREHLDDFMETAPEGVLDVLHRAALDIAPGRVHRPPNHF